MHVYNIWKALRQTHELTNQLRQKHNQFEK